MNTLLGIFALGTLGFWLLILLDFILITALVENESGGWATFTAICTILGLNYVWKFPVFEALRQNPGHAAILVGSYFALGIGWSIFKWYLFLHKQTRRYEDFKAQFMLEYKITTLTPESAAKLMEAVAKMNQYKSKGDRDYILTQTPLFRNHAGDLTRWATYWPFSMIGFALNDIVRKAWRHIIEMLQTTYQRIANHVFRNINADQAMAEEYKAQAAAASAGSTTRKTRYDQ